MFEDEVEINAGLLEDHVVPLLDAVVVNFSESESLVLEIAVFEAVGVIRHDYSQHAFQSVSQEAVSVIVEGYRDVQVVFFHLLFFIWVYGQYERVPLYLYEVRGRVVRA